MNANERARAREKIRECIYRVENLTAETPPDSDGEGGWSPGSVNFSLDNAREAFSEVAKALTLLVDMVENMD